MQENSATAFQTYGLRQPNRGHSILLLSLIALNVVTFIVMIFINAASTITSIGIFDVPTGNISDKYPVEITPSGWTFSVWGVIYAWQALWLIFNVGLIFKKNDYGRLYREPPVLNLIFHLVIFSNFSFNITWLFVWAEEKFGISFGIILLMLITLYFALFLSHKNIYEAEPYLNKNRIILWLYRILVNNGLAFYATWITLATNLNLAIAITYEWQDSANDKHTGSIIALSILLTILFIYFILDVWLLEKFLRYTWSPYILLAIGLPGILSNNWSASRATSILTLILTVFGPGIGFLVKIIVTVYKHNRSRR